jgi:hypothetical protein
MEAMTDKTNKESHALNRLADAFADDILGLSDEEVLAEFTDSHGDPAKNAADMRALFEKTVVATNKRRLEAAQAAVASVRRPSAPTPAADIAGARQKLRRLLASDDAGHHLTLAARKEDELSDADVVGMLEDLNELGVITPDDEPGDER